VAQERILIVDDEPYVLDICRRILEENYAVEIVSSGLEAIQLAQNNTFDLLLTDIKMPGIDGLETARELKRLNAEIVCVTMTGYSTMETAIKALRLGIDEFVIKPFAPEELNLAVERALEKERLRKENIRLKSLVPLFEFNKVLLTTINADEILAKVLNLAIENTAASAGILLMLADDSNKVIDEHRSGNSQHLAALQPFEADLVNLLRTEAQQLTVDNTSQHPLLSQVVQTWQAEAITLTPLFVKKNVSGLLCLAKHSGQFSPSEQNFLSVMTGQAAIAYENARLFQDLQKAYEELKTLDFLKSEFTNIAAHELRTPLAVLIGYISVMQETAEGTSKEYLDIVLRNAMRLRRIVSDLLNMRNIAHQQVQLDISPVNIAQLIEKSLSDFAIIAQRKNITLSQNLPPKLPLLHTDYSRLETIIENLLSNAIKFTPAGGQVNLHVKEASDGLQLSVVDTGIGIPEDEFERIFDRFYQVENSLNRRHEGIGLGLAIAKGLLEACGGSISVTSTPGKGSTFRCYIPLTAPQKPISAQNLL
jgi:signal transduction histidine kinase